MSFRNITGFTVKGLK